MSIFLKLLVTEAAIFFLTIVLGIATIESNKWQRRCDTMLFMDAAAIILTGLIRVWTL